MKDLKILGTGCAKCKALADVAENAAKEIGEAYTLEKVTEIQKIMTFGVMLTPALVVNGKVVVSGKVPSLQETKKLLA